MKNKQIGAKIRIMPIHPTIIKVISVAYSLLNSSESYTQLSGNKLFDLTVVVIFPIFVMIAAAFKKWVPVEQEHSRKRKKKGTGKKEKKSKREVPKSVVKTDLYELLKTAKNILFSSSSSYSSFFFFFFSRT